MQTVNWSTFISDLVRKTLWIINGALKRFTYSIQSAWTENFSLGAKYVLKYTTKLSVTYISDKDRTSWATI